MLQKAIKNINARVEETTDMRRSNRSKAFIYGRHLINQTKEDFESLSSQLSDKHSDFKKTANNLAKEIMQCGIDFFKAHMEDVDSPRDQALELLKKAGQIATETYILQRVDDNIQGIEDWYLNKTTIDDQDNIYDFNKIRMQTAFSFMTCDGDIDGKEVELIRKMDSEQKLFGDIDVDTELDFLVEVINQKGKGYLKDYFKVIKNAKLSIANEIELVEIAMNTLIADGRLDYNEMKFFRIFRTLLQVSDEEMLMKVPSLPEEFLESDIFTNSYMDSLFDYFESVEIPKFDKISDN
ncbi:MAG: TerB family tellurite resistance protein [Reichenbachiella sp.]